MRTAIVLTTALTLTGCVDVGSLMPEDKAPSDTSFYLLDTRYKFFCLGTTKKCWDMTKIVSSRNELRPIEQAYGKEVKGPNYPVTLANMIMYPADGSYTTKPIGDDGRYVRVPINDKTRIVWETLGNIEENLFK
jgi:hypothetical protein